MKTFVTLEIEFDPRQHDHPEDWDWGALADTVDPVRVFGSVRDEGGRVTYRPFPGGWRAEHDDGRVKFVYLNPSRNDPGDPEADEPNVFLYQGLNGDLDDAGQDEAVIHLLVFADEEPTS